VTAPEAVAIGVLVLLLATNVYRAWTQSITIDEARSYNIFISEPLSRMFAVYDATNHVLQTLLSKISIMLFGLAEFTLRLPSVLGGLLYLVSCYRLSRYLFGTGWLLTFSVLALGLNPAVLDYLSAARGYGLGLGLLMWAFTHLVLYFGDQDERRLFKAGIGLGLSVTAMLAFLYPAVALAALIVGILAVDGRRLWVAVEKFVGPGIITAFVLLVLPLSHAKREQFFYGVSTITDFVSGLVHLSYYHSPRTWMVGRYLPEFGSWYWVIWAGIVPAFVLATLIAGAIAARRWVRSRQFAAVETNDRVLLLLGGAMALMLLMIVAARHLFGVLYPSGRTGIYWAPMMTLAVLLLIGKKYVRIPALVFAVFSVLMFAGGITIDSYPEWMGERKTKEVMRLIEARHGGREVRLGASWPLEAGSNFYRRRFRLDWMKPVERTGADGDFDYYYLLAKDAGLIEKRKLRTLWRDPETGTALAEKP
jgi:Dolichyl-phosphate-mannose-protein mannosyltransferase